MVPTQAVIDAPISVSNALYAPSLFGVAAWGIALIESAIDAKG
jgi:hypothetical protein